MGVPFRSVIFNAREELLSGDVNRAQQLLSKAVQDELRNEVLDTGGVPINCFTKPPTCVGNTGSYTVAIGAGEAMVDDATGVTADDSSFKVVQWAAQNLLHANPDPTNGRIDLVVVTPATSTTDNVVRNVLTDPTTRTFAPATVPKTSTPVVVPVVVTGTPGASPLPPAVPSGAYAILEVFVEPGSADASQWPITPRLFRKSGYPLTGMSPIGNTFSGGVGVPIVYAPQCGIIRGCNLVNANVPGVISSSESPGLHTVVIDGEVIDFSGTVAASLDTVNPPVGPAPANNDVPYFLYLVGGRNLPSNNLTGAPVQMVASLTPPNVITGRPTAAVGTLRGTTSSAVFLGCGWVLKNASTYRAVDWHDGWAYMGASGGVFSQNQDITGSGAFTVNAAPSIADQVKFNAGLTFPGGSPGTLILGDYEDEQADPGATTLSRNGIIQTRLVAGVIATAAVAGLTLARLSAVAFHIPGIRRLG